MPKWLEGVICRDEGIEDCGHIRRGGGPTKNGLMVPMLRVGTPAADPRTQRRGASQAARPRLCISRGDSINCSGFGPEANGWLLRLPPVLQTLHGFSMPPIALKIGRASCRESEQM